MKKGLSLITLAVGLMVVATGCAGGAKPAAAPAASIAPAASTAASSKPTAPTVVKMAINNTWKPFGFVDANDKLAGYNVDILNAINTKIPDYKFEYEGVDQAALFVGVDSGKDVLGAGSFFKTPEREQKYLFPDENYGSIVMYLAVKKDRTDINSLDDMAGKKLAPLMPNTSNYNIIKDYNTSHPDKQIKLETIDNILTADAMKGVESGKYDAFLLPGMTFYDTQKDLKLNLKLSNALQKNPIYFVLNKSQTDLKTKMDKAVKELIQDGTLPKISEKWLGEDIFKK
jgi:L-cystine transport system substrate-binding protein